jgi:hypothetical protein
LHDFDTVHEFGLGTRILRKYRSGFNEVDFQIESTERNFIFEVSRQTICLFD